ncbi:Peptidase inhibitor family I36 [Amycolatopsis marina]|uniref:Peptidase inhibitor family I36 n=1 Tax=Amycolatopsis marina TaxID=490629 RepID=A0A1I1ADY5_9PSEU|nr:peptidase inhibitor family I36 protein [Amycolatopsis marina]SFB36215.1 Peptidase inhibitor family I36 [Amycolatopsis marina]
MRKTAGVLVTVAAAGGLALMATPASADTAEVLAGSCSSGNICLFENNDFNQGNTNHWRDFRGNVSNFNNYNWVGSSDNMDNETSSIKNRVGCGVTLYQHVGYGGDSTYFRNGANDGFLANNKVGDNRASAVRKHC